MPDKTVDDKREKDHRKKRYNQYMSFVRRAEKIIEQKIEVGIILNED